MRDTDLQNYSEGHLTSSKKKKMYGCSRNADVFWEIGWAGLRIYGADHKQEYNKE